MTQKESSFGCGSAMDPSNASDAPSQAVFQSQTLYTVEQLVEAEPALTVGGVRHDLFHRTTNGLQKSGAVIRRGRRILIHRERYLGWLFSRNGRVI